MDKLTASNRNTDNTFLNLDRLDKIKYSKK